MKYKLYRTNWSYTDGTGTNESVKEYCLGTVLNVCSGKSRLGDLLIDLDPTTNPDLVADCKHLPIRDNSFDTVMIDPPYQYFVTGSDRFRWFNRLADIARKRVILSIGQIAIRLNKFTLTDITAVITNTFFVRLWYIYDRKQFDLDI